MHRVVRTVLPVGTALLIVAMTTNAWSGPLRSPLITPPPDWTAKSSIGAFGGSLAAGDVNCDGYQDLVVGAPTYSNNQIKGGVVFVYDGSANGLASSASWTKGSVQTAADFGFAVTSMDVNGDGCDDVIVGAPLYNSGQSDEGKVFAYYGSVNGLPSTANWSAESDEMGAQLGYAVAALGPDLIVGAPTAGTKDQGAVYLYEGGGPGGLNAMPTWIFHSPDANGDAGFSVAGIAGSNGGATQVAVGAPYWNNANGEAFVLRGTTGASRWKVRAKGRPSGGLGWSVAGGDVNFDGWGDLMVGWPGHGTGNQGRVLLYEGNATGIHGPAAWTKNGAQPGEDFGHTVAFVDLNGDNRSDVAVGATDGEGPGDVFVYRGSDSGPPSSATWHAKSTEVFSGFGHAIAAGWFRNACCERSLAVGAPAYGQGGAAFVFDHVL